MSYITLNKTSSVFKVLDKYIELAEKVRIVQRIKLAKLIHAPMNCKVMMRRHLLTGKGSAEHKTMNVLHILKQSTPNIIYAGMLVRQLM